MLDLIKTKYPSKTQNNVLRHVSRHVVVPRAVYDFPRASTVTSTSIRLNKIRMLMCCGSAQVRLGFQVCGGSAHRVWSANQH